jgi:hypothetical protein
MAEPSFDNADQLKRIQTYLVQGETLHAVWDCKGAGTAFVGITDQRLIFYDQGVLIKKKAMVSIPFNRVIGVASADNGGLVFKSTELALLTAAGRFEFEFRGADKAHWTSMGEVSLQGIGTSVGVDDCYPCPRTVL